MLEMLFIILILPLSFISNEIAGVFIGNIFSIGFFVESFMRVGITILLDSFCALTEWSNKTIVIKLKRHWIIFL